MAALGSTLVASACVGSSRTRPSLGRGRGPRPGRRGTSRWSCTYGVSKSDIMPHQLCRSDPFDLEPALAEPVLNLPLALKLRHLHELTNKVASRELLHLVVLHPVPTRPHDLARVRIEEGAIVWVRSRRATPDDPRRVIRMPEEDPIGVSLQPQRLHATPSVRRRRSSACWTCIASITRSINAWAVSRVRGIARNSA